MTITDIKRTIDGTTIQLSAQIVSQTGLLKRIYFETDTCFSWVHDDATPFLAAILLPSMKLGENITVDGRVSKKFLANTKRIMQLVANWGLGLSPIEIYTKGTVNDSFLSGNVGIFFSGGVDSFYTYLKVRSTYDKRKIKLLFIEGFDIPVRDVSTLSRVRKQIGSVAKIEQVDAIIVRTNIRDILDRLIPWDYAHGSVMASVALFLRKGIGNVYFSGGIEMNALRPYGTHPNLDPLWSTEKLHVLHYGCHVTRLGKVGYISSSKTALKFLRVCWRNKKGIDNCGKCEKCLRTMILLATVGSLTKCKMFHIPIDHKRLASLHLHPSYVRYYRQALSKLVRQGEYPYIAKAIEKCIKRNTSTRWWYFLIVKIREYIGSLDAQYFNGNAFRFMNKYGLI